MTATAKLLDGKAVSGELLPVVERQARDFATLHHRPVTLAVMLIGENPASSIYVRNKVRACAQVGITSLKKEFPRDVALKEVLAQIDAWNRNNNIHGILIQLPLPPHLPTQDILTAVDPSKDVDGFHPVNLGRLVQGIPSLAPCTPRGIMRLLAHANIPISGQQAVVIGRSTIVGKPMALMLLAEGATMTVCHTKTRDVAEHARRADILVVAVGQANLIGGDMVKSGATVIDVGINRLNDGSLCGDVNFAEACLVASAITPVPGGVGPLTIATLLQNTVDAAVALAQ